MAESACTSDVDFVHGDSLQQQGADAETLGGRRPAVVNATSGSWLTSRLRQWNSQATRQVTARIQPRCVTPPRLIDVAITAAG